MSDCSQAPLQVKSTYLPRPIWSASPAISTELLINKPAVAACFPAFLLSSPRTLTVPLFQREEKQVACLTRLLGMRISTNKTRYQSLAGSNSLNSKVRNCYTNVLVLLSPNADQSQKVSPSLDCDCVQSSEVSVL